MLLFLTVLPRILVLNCIYWQFLILQPKKINYGVLFIKKKIYLEKKYDSIFIQKTCSIPYTHISISIPFQLQTKYKFKCFEFPQKIYIKKRTPFIAKKNAYF